jgi:hypothetical protein
MTVKYARAVSRSRWLRAVVGTVLVCVLLFAMHLVMLGLALFTWRRFTFAKSLDLSLLTVSALLSLPVVVVLLLATLRAASAGRSGSPVDGARVLARLGLGLAVAAATAYAATVVVVLAVTDPQPDGRWQFGFGGVLASAQELALNFLAVFLAFKTVSFTGRLPRSDRTTVRGD